jgi:hypothetical protein
MARHGAIVGLGGPLSDGHHIEEVSPSSFGVVDGSQPPAV